MWYSSLSFLYKLLYHGETGRNGYSPALQNDAGLKSKKGQPIVETLFHSAQWKISLLIQDGLFKNLKLHF